jgi:lipopolysaccharide transport system ATP-binding protein
MKPIIRIENLSKRYRLGTGDAGYRTIRETIMDGLRAPFQNFRHLRELTNFNGDAPPCTPDGLSSSPDTVWALRNISLDVAPGETLGIIGRNGAGKSTLLKILSRITDPTAGDVRIWGRLSSLLEVGTGFHPELTGRENIYLNGAILGMRKAEIKGKFDEIVTFAEIEKALDTPVKRYSSGMYVRLAFAVAAHLEPEILLVDEVLAVGDNQFQEKCLGKMNDVSNSGRTVLFVSHNMGAILSLCRQVVVLTDGQVTFTGDAAEGIRHYRGSVAKGSVVALDSLRQGRRGPQFKATLIGMEILDGQRRASDTFAMGDPLIIRLTLRIKETMRAPRIGVMLRNSMDALVHDFTSAFNGFLPELSPGLYTLEVTTEPLRVYPGAYTLGPWIQQAVGIPSDDYIRAALSISIVDRKGIGHPEARFDIITKEGTETYHPCSWKEMA